ncbi:MAG: hypothetical protein PHV62_09655, partial [Sulfuricurvum sp.]|nr:hypothetical protein [Sulfuricurvum sp.]
NGELAGTQGMTAELLYQDKFLNIFFRAVKSCYENDKVMGGEVLRHQAMLSANGKQEDQSQIQVIIDKVFERETSRVLSLFQQSDKIKIQTFLEGKIDELLKLAGKQNSGATSDQEVGIALEEISHKLDEFLRLGGSENLPSEIIALLQKIDRNVVSVNERQVLLLKRIEEMTEPAPDFLSDVFPKDMGNRPEELNREDVLEEIRTLSGTVEKMFSSLKELEMKNQLSESPSRTTPLANDDPMFIFGETIEPEPAIPTGTSPIQEPIVDMDQIAKLFEGIISNAISPITKEFGEIREQISSLESKVEKIGEISSATNELLKSEINETNEYIAKLNGEQ